MCVLLITLLDDDFFVKKTFAAIIWQVLKNVLIINGIFFVSSFVFVSFYMPCKLQLNYNDANEVT